RIGRPRRGAPADRCRPPGGGRHQSDRAKAAWRGLLLWAPAIDSKYGDSRKPGGSRCVHLVGLDPAIYPRNDRPGGRRMTLSLCCPHPGIAEITTMVCRHTRVVIL